MTHSPRLVGHQIWKTLPSLGSLYDTHPFPPSPIWTLAPRLIISLQNDTKSHLLVPFVLPDPLQLNLVLSIALMPA